MKKLCIYHGGCYDGYGAYMSVVHHFGTEFVEGHPGKYGEAPPDVTGREVFIVDFSYKRDVLIEMAKQATRIVIIDHHKTAEADLTDLNIPNVEVNFDMTRSGAMMTWNYFNKEQAPDLLLHIQDRDLWNWKLPWTKEVMLAVCSYPMEESVWFDLMDKPVRELMMEGCVLLRKHDIEVQKLVANAHEEGPDKIPCVNVLPQYASDVLNILAEGKPYAMGFTDVGFERRFSLRSSADGVDVSEIAKKYGGGGHKHAAGFSLTIRHIDYVGLKGLV
jgi:oligoribonuclease NrnB/cAMP/cGMP phosphodiesterase (DHH superfamily)